MHVVTYACAVTRLVIIPKYFQRFVRYQRGAQDIGDEMRLGRMGFTALK
jgi:hypothetical protein